MTLTVERDLELIRSGLARWLGRPVAELTRPAPGYSCETVVVDRSFVVRLPPAGEGIFPSYDLGLQAAAQNAAGAAGVPVAGPARYEPDPDYLGDPFIVLPFVEGPIPIDFTPADPWLVNLPDDRARRAVWQSFVGTIASIHDAATDALATRRGLRAELDYWDDYLTWATDGSPPPALADALRWCRDNQPVVESRAGLLWGDVRFGNVVFDDVGRAPKAVLDWDMTGVGPVELDVGWYLALETVQTELSGARVPGFGTRDETIALVSERIGRPLLDLGWYEVFALVRASAIQTRITILFERAGRRPMFAVGDDPTLAVATARISH